MTRFFRIFIAIGTTLLGWMAISTTPTNLRVVVAGQVGNSATSSSDAAIVSAGRDTFTTNCSFCHGSDAHGGAEGGPDLTRSTVVTADVTGRHLVEFLKTGRPPRMPAFDLPDAQVAAIIAFLQFQIVANGNGGGDPKAILVGDAKAGESYFNGAGKCIGCHSVSGDLKSIGSKYDPITLQGRMVLPRSHGGYPGASQNQTYGPDAPRTVTVTLGSGQQVSGELIAVSDYNVTLKDSAGTRYTFARNEDVPKVMIKDPAQAHLDMIPKLTNKNMHDLTAYLVTLK